MSKPKCKAPAAKPEALFDRIASILDQARKNVVRAVNTNMVLAYMRLFYQAFPNCDAPRHELRGTGERAEDIRKYCRFYAIPHNGLANEK